ncbi:DUF4239 domain-containing protein [Streptomyces sp. TRM66268-LWL]|uniref:DUF4239 domain-containing protein n=1 Tax=Streptomyces polyasparticus TaxID=2767826 RepID=A0ABR7SAZ3_9ACTN|nr:DUF4239 domain-containing protein [Streptomyces polyasparticus]MBC9712651.1 DUF4239 domain-containing protein [Streptomyces polyasparticus]
MPPWLVMLCAVAAIGAVIYLTTGLVQRRVGEDDDPSQTPDVIEYMTMMIGVVYAIVLGLAIAGVWEARGTAQGVVDTEAQALHEVYERAEVYPEAERSAIRQSVDAYVTYAVRTEWAHLAERHRLTEEGNRLFTAVRHTVQDSEPRNELQGQAYAPMTDQVAIADDARAARLAAAAPTMPGVVWLGLVTGALVSIGMVFALQIRRTPRELVVAGLYSALFAFLLYLIWDMDTPFSRSMAIGADAFLQRFPGAGG